jgi:hypothetical protein
MRKDNNIAERKDGIKVSALKIEHSIRLFACCAGFRHSLMTLSGKMAAFRVMATDT